MYAGNLKNSPGGSQKRKASDSSEAFFVQFCGVSGNVG